MSVINDGLVRDQQSGHMDGGLVLDQWNGRATEILLREDGEDFLRWLVIGQDEPVDVWLQLELRPEESQELLRPGPVDLWAFVGDHKESQVRMSLDVGGVEVLWHPYQNPGGSDAVATLLASFRAALILQANKILAVPDQADRNVAANRGGRARVLIDASDEIKNFLTISE